MLCNEKKFELVASINMQRRRPWCQLTGISAGRWVRMGCLGKLEPMLSHLWRQGDQTKAEDTGKGMVRGNIQVDKLVWVRNIERVQFHCYQPVYAEKETGILKRNRFRSFRAMIKGFYNLSKLPEEPLTLRQLNSISDKWSNSKFN